jgi:hypothetical protein
MKEIAAKGHRYGPHHLSPEECLEVAEAIVSQSLRLQRNLDLRLLINTFQDRLQWANGESETHWLHMLESRMKERVLPPGGETQTRAGRKAAEQALAREIKDWPREQRLEAWRTATGKSEPALYKRMQEVEALDSQAEVISDNGLARTPPCRGRARRPG